ncbi:MAG: type 4a pilus biogenesis protein PilO [Planctomycetota bacterium]
MQIDKSQWVVIGSIFLMVAAFTLGVWLPESKKIAAYQERIAHAEEELGPSFFKPALMDERANEVQALKQELNSSTRHVPNRPELASVLKSLTEAVESQEVSGQSLQTRDTRSHRHYSEIPLSLEFEDTFAASYGILQRIESLPRLVRVDAMNMRVLNRDETEHSSPVMQTSLRLSSFYTGREEN